MEVQASDVLAVKQDFSVIDVVESHHEVHKCTLAATGLSNQGHVFVRVDSDVEASEDKLLLSGWVSKPNVLEFNFALDTREF